MTERTITADGTLVVLPEVVIDGLETTLTEPVEEVIALYADHGTHKQFHSEFKTDLDLERLPSSKFGTNVLVMSLAEVAYNILRLIDKQSLLNTDGPLRHPAKRRRVKTVMQEMMRVAAQLTEHARRVALNFGRHCPAFPVWRDLYAAWTVLDWPIPGMTVANSQAVTLAHHCVRYAPARRQQIPTNLRFRRRHNALECRRGHVE